MEIKCPFWNICGPGEIFNSLAKRFLLPGDLKQNYTERVCNGEKEYEKCEHFKIREKKEEK